MENKKLTKRQAEILTFIKKYIAEHGYPPAIREICAGVGLNSPATVFVHIKNLQRDGYLRSTNNKFRTIEVIGENEYLEKNEDVVKVPLLGKITAGNPITAIEQPNEFFALPASLLPSKAEVFTLKVSGESMINKGRQNTARNGEIVVAMTDEDEVTLKTFYKEKDHIRLQPENDTMAPFIFDNVTILGIAIGLYRNL